MNTARTTIAATAATLALAHGASAQSTFFVDDDAQAGGDGLSWPTALNSLEDALALAQGPGDQVWVAAGTYTPRATGDETSSFTIANGVSVYGGFEGTEKFLVDRGDPTDNRSILDGDIASGQSNDINHLVTIDGGSNVVLDGFTIINGFADGAVRAGGGVLIIDSGVTLRNLQVQDCVAGAGTIDSRGGGIAVLGSTSTLNFSDSTVSSCSSYTAGGLFAEGTFFIDNVEFTQNTASSSGGAIRVEGDGVWEIVGSTFRENSTDNGSGGAIRAHLEQVTTTTALLIDRTDFIDNESRFGSAAGAISFTGDGFHEVQRSRFIGNSTRNEGGAIVFDPDGSSDLLVENSFFSGNEAGRRGGAIHQSAPNKMRVIGSTFVGNTSGEFVGSAGDGLGGAIFTAAGDCFITNCILWDNDNLASAGQPRQDQFSFSGSAGGVPRDVSLDYCIVQGWAGSPVDGMNTTGADPLLEDADGPDDSVGTADDSPALAPFSPAIDAGFSLAVTPIGSFADVLANARFADDPGTSDTGGSDGVNPIVDIGAAEFGGVSLACPGDTNGDNTIDTADLLVLLANFGQPTANGPSDGDFDGSGSVNTADLLVLLGGFGTSC